MFYFAHFQFPFRGVLGMILLSISEVLGNLPALIAAASGFLLILSQIHKNIVQTNNLKKAHQLEMIQKELDIKLKSFQVESEIGVAKNCHTCPAARHFVLAGNSLELPKTEKPD